MTLHDAQAAHVFAIARLIKWAYEQGYEMTWGEAYRTEEMAALDELRGLGIKNSVHCKRLAVDLMLFKDGVYLTDPEAYRPLGTFWKQLNPQARWGGDFKTVDADHFSFTWQGVS